MRNRRDVLDLAGFILALDEVVDSPEIRGEAVDAEELLECSADVVAAGDARHHLHAPVARADRDGVAAPMHTPTTPTRSGSTSARVSRWLTALP